MDPSNNMEPSTAESVETMRDRFRRDKNQSQSHAWESLWQDGVTPWDLGAATPALVSELANHWNTAGPAKSIEKQNLKSLIPGCGAGYDLVTLARHHDDLVAAGQVKDASVVGLDLSETSLHQAAEQIEKALEFCPFDRPTRIDLLQGDFFENSKQWRFLYSFGGTDNIDKLETGASSHLDDHKEEEASFDFIFDYTFFCALPPARRKEWGARMSQLLTPETGRLLTFVFPILSSQNNGVGHDQHRNEDNNPPAKGPPFPVTPRDYQRVLEPVGVTMASDGAYESGDTVPQRVGMELVCWWSMNGLDSERMKAAKL